jgi:hypothetical protein
MLAYTMGRTLQWRTLLASGGGNSGPASRYSSSRPAFAKSRVMTVDALLRHSLQ